eukprot:1133377-Rhodomonas_salina.1
MSTSTYHTTAIASALASRILRQWQTDLYRIPGTPCETAKRETPESEELPQNAIRTAMLLLLPLLACTLSCELSSCQAAKARSRQISPSEGIMDGARADAESVDTVGRRLTTRGPSMGGSACGYGEMRMRERPGDRRKRHDIGRGKWSRSVGRFAPNAPHAPAQDRVLALELRRDVNGPGPVPSRR